MPIELEELKGSVIQLGIELHRLQSIFRTYSVTINDLGESQRKPANPVVVTIEQRSEEDFVACFYDADIYGYGDSIPECLDDLKLQMVSQLQFLSREEKRVDLGVFPAKQLAVLRNLITERTNPC
ncbi:MAG: hypothetical protein QME81_13695 [bacterium]|nr:hypothetical protein [bacterium]